MILDLKNNLSISKIVAKTGLAKSTIYYYYRKVNGKKYKKPTHKISFSEIEGEIVGIFAGDGSQYHYRPNGQYLTTIHFGNVENYVIYVKKLFENYFGRSWRIWKETNRKGQVKYRIRAINKELFYFFNNYLKYDCRNKHNTCQLRGVSLNRMFKIGFLRGFFDTDGCLSTSNNRLRAFYYTTSKELVYQMKVILEELGISSIVWCKKRKNPEWKDLFVLRIREREVNKFLSLVRPYKVRKLGR